MPLWWVMGGWIRQEDRQDVLSEDGKVVFNYLQQREEDTSERLPTPLEEAGGTDPGGFTD